MEKILYLQIEKTQMSREEKIAFQAFFKMCEADDFRIIDVKGKEDFLWDEDKKTGAKETSQNGLFCIAVCDTQEGIDSFTNKNIPVVAYESNESIRLNNPYIILSFEGVDVSYLKKVHHRMKGIPLQIMETARTRIREFAMDDLDALFHLYDGKHVTDYMEPLYPYDEEKEYEKNYIKNVYGLYDYGMWLVIHKESGEVIGRAGIESRGGVSGVNKETFSDDRSDADTVELGYLIREDYQHKGYGTEVCGAIVAYAFDELGKKRIYAQVDQNNIISRKLLKKLGFEDKGAELFEILN